MGNGTGPGWDEIVATTRDGMKDAVKQWASMTMVQHGSVQRTDALIPPGGLTSGMAFDHLLQASLLEADVPADVARALSARLWKSWKQWADGFTIQLPGLFPMFATYPGPMAPPTPGVGMTPVSRGLSTGAAALTGVRLGPELEANVPGTGGDERRRALRELADWVEETFQSWKALSHLQGHKIMGTGPVPTFQPPHVPAGPVVGGRLLPAGPGAISAVEFGFGMP